jgi:gas vesicle protein
MANDDNRTTAGALMLLAGGIIGASLAILYAPQSGVKTRRQLTRCARRARNDAESMIHEAAETVSDAVEDLGEKTADLIDRGGDVAEDWRSYLLNAIDRGQKELEKQRKKLDQLWS